MKRQIKSLTIKFIPHKKQRYETCGDWIIKRDGNHVINISICGDQDSENLVAVHEIIEMILCLKRGIKQEVVDAYDKKMTTPPYDKEDPGMCSDAPYHKEHFFAEIVERMLASELKRDWNEHDSLIGFLSKED